MINLNDQPIIDFKTEYLLKMKLKVTEKYEANKSIFNNVNNFTGETIKQSMGVNVLSIDELVEDILTKKIDEVLNKYLGIRMYFETASFIFLTQKKLNFLLNEVGTKDFKRRQETRKNYMCQYSNSWINCVLSNHSDYFKSNINMKKFIDDLHSKLKEINQILKKVIDYDMISNKLRHEIMHNFDVEICPYCNRNFISKYTRSGVLKTTADLDHFFPKSIFQLFSLSLYNFVPSCQICNSRMKGDTGVEIIHPYSEIIDYSKLKFKVELNEYADINFLSGTNLNAFDIKIECSDSKYQEHLDLFRLEELYNTHKSVVSDILFKKRAYNHSYSAMINNLFEEMNLTQTQKELFLYGVELNQAKFHLKPLSKLIYDVVKSEEV